jgi:DHA2 family multidrug resistance protein
MAKAEFAHIVVRQSLTLAFDDVFRLMAWLFLAALVMVPFCRPAATNSAAAEAH